MSFKAGDRVQHKKSGKKYVVEYAGYSMNIMGSKEYGNENVRIYGVRCENFVSIPKETPKKPTDFSLKDKNGKVCVVGDVFVYDPHSNLGEESRERKVTFVSDGNIFYRFVNDHDGRGERSVGSFGLFNSAAIKVEQKKDPGYAKIGQTYVGVGDRQFIVESLDRVFGDNLAYYNCRYLDKNAPVTFYFPDSQFKPVFKYNVKAGDKVKHSFPTVYTVKSDVSSDNPDARVEYICGGWDHINEVIKDKYVEPVLKEVIATFTNITSFNYDGKTLTVIYKK